MNSNELNIKNKMKKCNRLADEIVAAGDEKKVISKVKKLNYELDSLREALALFLKNAEEPVMNELKNMFDTSASGTVEIIGEDWLHLRLEMTLPSERNHAEVKRLSNTVTNLLNCHSGYLGYLPAYERAHVVIVEHKSIEDTACAYDNDNKGYRAISNALKGRVFADDNQFTVSYGLFTVHDENDPHCDIYVIPLEDNADFATHYLIF